MAAVAEAGWMAATDIVPNRPMHSSIAMLAAGLGVLILGGFTIARQLSGSSRWVAMGAVGCFILGDGIRFLGLAISPEWMLSLGRWGLILAMPAPVAGVYSTDAGIVGALLIGFLFIRTRSAELRTDFSTLEEHVTERTAKLESAMESLAVANAKLIEQSNIDSLTGVGNRRFFDEALRRNGRSQPGKAARWP